MSTPFAEFCCARLPAGSLPRLGPLRAGDIRIVLDGDSLWLFWATGEPELSRAILAIDGAELFSRRGEHWYPGGRHLPAFDVPSSTKARPLFALLIPAPVEPLEPISGWLPVPLRLAPSAVPRPCSLLRVPLADLAMWAENATSHQLSALVATRHQGVVLLRGDRLPPIPGDRFWGRRVLLPLGREADPNLAEEILATALRLEPNELALVTEVGAEIVPLAAFEPLTRAGVRLAAQEVAV